LDARKGELEDVMISSLTIAAVMFLPGSARAPADISRAAAPLPQEAPVQQSAEVSPAVPLLPLRLSPEAFAAWVGPSLIVPSQYDYGYITW
jgi:hypothetical protein